MKKITTVFALLLILSFILASVSDIGIVKAEPKTIFVPDDFSTIQDAIDNADEGDTIFVKSGTYIETLVVDKSLSLIGDNSNTTIIDGNYTQVYSVIKITSNNVKITGFTIQRSGGVKYYERAGIHIEYSNGNNISYNIITDNYGDGIRLEGSSNNLILSNNITENHSGVAILYSSLNNTIQKNRLIDNFSGIYVSDSDNQSLLQNTVKLSGNNGIDIDDSSNNVIFGNIVLDSYNFGMVIYRSAGDIIYQNHLSTNIKGIWLSFSENNTVFRNNLTNNEHGLDICSSSNNLIFENVIFNNEIGILLTSINPMSNTVWNNDFVDNTKQALDDSSEANVFWDNGSEGNYWRDYDGTDNNDDGIGDTPYVIDENNRDNYPLIESYIIPEFPSSTELAFITKPSVPEFTVKLVNGTIEVKVKNQPFVSYYDTSINWTIDLYYNIRIKGNFSENWIELYLIEEVPTSSYSEYTVLSYSPIGENSYILGNRMIDFPAGSKVDFQVEAMIGYVHRVYNPNWTNQLEMYPYVFTGKTSGWSATRTIPEQEPRQIEAIEIILAIGLIVIVIGVGLLVYFKKRKG